MKNKFIAVLALICAFHYSITAQSLLPPLEEMPLSQNAYLRLKSGKNIEGKILFTNSGRGINKVALKDKAGNKLEYKAADIHEFGILSNGLVKMQYLNESSASVKALLKTDRSAILLNDYVVFRNASLKGGKELLLQLLNPHFDEKIQVYHAVNSHKTTALRKGNITLTGEMQRVYLVSKVGSTTMKVKKGSYKKSFRNLFGDCEALLAVKKPRFKDFGKHIYYYTNDCGEGFSDYYWEE